MAEELPLFPLNTVLFPGMPLPLHIFEPRYREMIGLCSQSETPFGVVLIKEGAEVGEAATPFDVGTLARIVGIDRLEDGRMNIVTVGTHRFRLVGYSTAKKPYIVGDVEPLVDDQDTTGHSAGLADEVVPLARRYVALVQAALEQDLTPLQLPDSPEEMSYIVAGALRIRNPERQRLLETTSTAQRLELEKAILGREIGTLDEFLQQRKGGLGPFSRN
jgi:Lon protease-like protein